MVKHADHLKFENGEIVSENEGRKKESEKEERKKEKITSEVRKFGNVVTLKK